MNDEEKPICSIKFSSFDYSKVEGIPELKIKVEFLNKMLSRVPDKNNKRVLEGVGAGETTILLLDIFKEVVVVEPNSESCNKLIKKIGKEGLSNIKFIKSKIEDADLSNEKVSTSNLRVISTSLKLNPCKSASQNSEHYDQLAFNMKGIHEKFDNIILSCVIEHLEYPVQVLKKLSTYLNEGGIMHIIIAQANSLHRLLGV